MANKEIVKKEINLKENWKAFYMDLLFGDDSIANLLSSRSDEENFRLFNIFPEKIPLYKEMFLIRYGLKDGKFRTFKQTARKLKLPEVSVKEGVARMLRRLRRLGVPFKLQKQFFDKKLKEKGDINKIALQEIDIFGVTIVKILNKIGIKDFGRLLEFSDDDIAKLKNVDFKWIKKELSAMNYEEKVPLFEDDEDYEEDVYYVDDEDDLLTSYREHEYTLDDLIYNVQRKIKNLKLFVLIDNTQKEKQHKENNGLNVENEKKSKQEVDPLGI